MSTATKLEYLNDTKQLLKENINNLGGSLTNEPFRQYASVLEGIYERLPKVSGIGASLSLSPSMVGKIKLNEIQGDTLQNGTPTPSSPVPIESVTGEQDVEICGKNIFNGEIRQGNQNYTTTSARLFSNKNDWYFTSGTKLTFSTDLPNTFKVCFYLAKKPYLSEQYTAMQNFSYFSNGEQNITLTADGYLGFTIAKNDETAITPSDVVNYHFQIEYGETKSSYKQYNGNTYEVNLGTIELNKIGDYEDSIKKSTGKNLCNGINQEVFLNATVDKCGIITGNTGLYIKVNGGTYTISTTTTQTRYRVACAINEPSATQQNVYNGVNKDNTRDSITIDTTGYNYLIVNVTDLSTVQIEQNSQATTYEPYGKVWYVEKNTKKIILDGSETPSQVNTSSTNTTRVSYNHYADGSTGLGLILCNILSYAPNWNNDTVGISYDASNGGFWFRINKTTIGTTQTEVQNWLSSHNLISYIALATPEYEVITNTELIEDLESLYNAKSKNGTTNINVDGSLPVILGVKALKGE